MINALDIIILAVVLWFSGFGLFRGLIRSVFNLAGVICALFFSIFWLPIVSGFIKKYLPLPETQIGFIAFVLTFILIVVGFRLVAKILHEGLKIVLLGWVDRIGGLLFGFIKGALLISALLWSVGLFPQTGLVGKMQNESIFVPVVKPVLPLVYDGIVAIFPRANSFEEKFDNTIEQIEGSVNKYRGRQKIKKEK